MKFLLSKYLKLEIRRGQAAETLQVNTRAQESDRLVSQNYFISLKVYRFWRQNWLEVTLYRDRSH